MPVLHNGTAYLNVGRLYTCQPWSPVWCYLWLWRAWARAQRSQPRGLGLVPTDWCKFKCGVGGRFLGPTHLHIFGCTSKINKLGMCTLHNGVYFVPLHWMLEGSVCRLWSPWWCHLWLWRSWARVLWVHVGGIGIVSTDRCKFKLGLEGDFLAQHFSIYLDVLASKINVDLTLRIVWTGD